MTRRSPTRTLSFRSAEELLAADPAATPNVSTADMQKLVRKLQTRLAGHKNQDAELIQGRIDIADGKDRENTLQRLNRTLTALGRSSQAAARAENEQDYLRDVCRIVVEDCGYAMVWIGFTEQDKGKTVRPAACAGFEEGYLETLKITWADTERGRGPTGTAIRTGKTTLCRNMLTDPKFKPWRSEAVKRGYASSAVLPLLAGGKAFGAICIYSKDPDAFAEDEVKTLEELANDLAMGISSIRLRTANAKARQAIEKHEAALRGILNATQESVWLFDVDGKILTGNKTALSRFNIPPEQILGKHFDDIMPAELAESRMKQLNKTVQSRKPVEFEDQREDKFFRNSLYPVLDANGQVTAIACFSRDITKRKQTDEAMRENEAKQKVSEAVKAEWQRFRRAMDQLPAYLVLLTPDYHVSFANRFFEERFGKSNGKRCFEYLFQRTEPCEKCETYKVLKTNAPHRWEWTGPDGRNYDIYDFPFTDPDGSSLIMEVGLDITEIKKAQVALQEVNKTLEKSVSERTAALQESKKDLDRAQEVGHIGWWRLDTQNNVLTWSDENHRIFGVPVGTPLTYETFLETIHPEDRQYVDAKWNAALHGKPYDVEHRILANGQVKWVREKAYLEFDNAGGLLGGFGITQDITDRKQAEESLKQTIVRFDLLAYTAGELLRSQAPQKIVDSLCRKVMEHLGCQVFFNYLADESAEKLHLNAYAGIDRQEAEKIEWLDYGEAVCGCVARDGCRVVAEHIPSTSDARTAIVKSYGVKAYACHPLLGEDDKVIGTLSFGTKDRQTFNEDDLFMMKAVADQVAVAMIRLKTREAILESRQLSESLNRINEMLHSNLDIDEIMRNLAKEGAGTLGFETAAVAIYEADRWIVKHVHGTFANTIGTKLTDEDVPHAALALHTGKTVVIEDAYNDKRVNRDRMRKFNIRSVIVSPLITRGKPIGAIFFNSHAASRRFSEAQIRFASQLGATASIALENSRLLDRHRRAVEALKKAKVNLENRVAARTGELRHTNRLLEDEIKERRLADEKLRMERQRFNDVLDRLPAYVVLLTPDCRRVFENKYCREQFGDLKDKRCHEFFYNRGEPCENCDVVNILKTNTPRHGEWKAPNGRIYETIDFPFTDVDGSRLIMKVGLDITQRKNTEKALLESRVLLVEAEHLARLGSWSWTVGSDRVTWSDELYRIFNWERDRPTPTYAEHFRLYHPESREILDKAVKRTLETGEPYDLELKYARKDGKVCWINARCNVAKDKNGRIIRLDGTVQDITTQKEAQLKLKETYAALEHRTEQLRRLASELTMAEQRERQKLVRILHDQLQQLLVGAEFRIATLECSNDEHIRKMAHGVRELIRQANETSRSLTMELSPPILHEAGLVPALEWLAGWMLDKYGLKVEFNTKENIEIDSEDIRIFLFQTIRELLFNVVKHADVHSSLISVAKVADHIRVTVEDRGKGFDAAEADSEKKAAGGLGLFSIKERLGLLGGEMSIVSEKGKGCRIMLTAPLHLSETSSWYIKQTADESFDNLSASRHKHTKTTREPHI